MRASSAKPAVRLIGVSASAAIGTFFGGCELLNLVESTSSVELYINEFMADNDDFLASLDGTGTYPDWLEIYNPNDEAVDLGGMYLTNDLDDPTKWSIPDGITIPPGGYLVFWADNNPDQGEMHTNFRLDSSGGELGLFDTDDNDNQEIDAVSYGDQDADESFGRVPDGDSDWQAMSDPTPGHSNQED